MFFGSIFSSSDYLPKIHAFCEGPLPPVPKKEEQEEMPAAEPQPLLNGCEVTRMLQNLHHH